MDGDDVETTERTAVGPEDRSLIEDLRLLTLEARSLAEAEVAYQKSRAGVFGSGIGKIAALVAIALLLLGLALVALVVGLLLALTPLLSAWGATALVTLGLSAVAAGVCFWVRSSWRGLLARITDNETAP